MRAGSASRRAQYRPFAGEVVGLGAAGGESSLAGAGAEGLRQGFPGFLDRPPGATAGGVEEALPVTLSWAVSASTASGSIGVVAAWSR